MLVTDESTIFDSFDLCIKEKCGNLFVYRYTIFI